MTGALILTAGLLGSFGLTYELTPAGVYQRNLRHRRRIPWSEISEVREVDRWQDGVTLVLQSDEVLKVPCVPRRWLPRLQAWHASASQQA